MGKKPAEAQPGDIFIIPLFLPSDYLKEYHLDYSKYQFPPEDVCAFGRLIEARPGNMDLIEVFSYVGQVPQSPEPIVSSGRMFPPEHIGHPYAGKGRWRLLFRDPGYNMWRDSDYENICFLSPVGHMWKGKDTVPITRQRRAELEAEGVPYWTFYDRTEMEERIRSVLEGRGLRLRYEQVIEARRAGFPKPRDLDKKLKEAIAPFRWLSGQGCYTLTLDAGLLHGECFERNHMLGNGYDWEAVAAAFLERQGMDADKTFRFDCEADTFSVSASAKKPLKDFALAFHALAMDAGAFEALLKELS